MYDGSEYTFKKLLNFLLEIILLILNHGMYWHAMKNLQSLTGKRQNKKLKLKLKKHFT
jgi:hypothetical protein